jgi:hypothetical protein
MLLWCICGQGVCFMPERKEQVVALAIREVNQIGKGVNEAVAGGFTLGEAQGR